MEVAKPLMCQRIGCSAKYTEDNNPPNCCVFHPGAPVFHDGVKEWSCCKAKSHDFGLFMDIKGCATGMHSREKPQKPPAPAPSAQAPIPVAAKPSADTSAVANNDPKLTCNRCRQGFFCSDHAAIPGVPAPPPQPKPILTPAPPKKEVDPNVEQLCKNKACGLKFKEKDNHDTACTYHPGPPIFHERKKGWGCCDKHAYDFDEFLSIPPCTKGRHNPNES
mmetsp:Transcript_38763/g.84344  ORF Transcript_38763/g.84344 Transcript_38763/m.84344 type:complete len:220 (-) Transcript_38763:185-844(-)